MKQVTIMTITARLQAVRRQTLPSELWSDIEADGADVSRLVLTHQSLGETFDLVF